MLISISQVKMVDCIGSASYSVVNILEKEWLYIFNVHTAFYLATILSVYSAWTYWIYMMLLNMKIQFNGCVCMQTRFSVELLIKMMLSARRSYIVVSYLRDLMRWIVVLRRRLNWSWENVFLMVPTVQRMWVMQPSICSGDMSQWSCEQTDR